MSFLMEYLTAQIREKMQFSCFKTGDKTQQSKFFKVLGKNQVLHFFTVSLQVGICRKTVN